jgi:hypothetical protein
MATAGIAGSVVVVSAVGLCLAGAISTSDAREPARDVAYVEAVTGRVIASSDGSPTLLDVLDVIGDGTRLDLPPNTELRVCHYRLRRLVTLKGPLRASISASGVTAEHGKTPNASAETCVEPAVSTLQGGLMTRNIALATTKVPLRPRIKIVNRGNKGIRRIELWDDKQRTMLTTFDRKGAARPVLDDGRSYLLVVEQSDGRELKVMLEASAENRADPLIFVVP